MTGPATPPAVSLPAGMSPADTLVIRRFSGPQPYLPLWQAMQAFTAVRGASTPDEIWLLEHTPVYTLGQAGKSEHLLHAGETPVIPCDRGGQITWHGPGQLMCYTLIDCQRRKLGARALVSLLETQVIDVLAMHGIKAYARADAPGVYVRTANVEAKIAALGLRIRKAGCYHGLALNLTADLAAFAGINPCGHAGMAVTRLTDLVSPCPPQAVIAEQLVAGLMQALDYRYCIALPADEIVPP